jgi:hypothetical protein
VAALKVTSDNFLLIWLLLFDACLILIIGVGALYCWLFPVDQTDSTADPVEAGKEAER